MPGFKAVLFDFNGIIIDDEPLHLRLFQEVCRSAGIELSTKAYYQRYLGFDDRGCFQAVFADHGQAVSCEKLEQLIGKKAEKYRHAIRGDSRLFPGVKAFIQALRRDKRWLAIVSGALRQEIRWVCEQHGLDKAFHVVVSADDTRFGKPHPEGYLKGLHALQALALPEALTAAECLVIEDSLAGIDAAHAAGMRCLAITNSYATEDLQRADWVRATVEGLILEELL